MVPEGIVRTSRSDRERKIDLKKAWSPGGATAKPCSTPELRASAHIDESFHPEEKNVNYDDPREDGIPFSAPTNQSSMLRTQRVTFHSFLLPINKGYLTA
jgi:hypothetical protein